MTKLNVISQFLSGNPVLTLILIAHFLADFQWQSQKMADLKSSNWTYLIRHLIIVALPLILLSVVIPHSFLVLSLIFLSHVLTDSGKLLLNSFYKDRSFIKAKTVFLIDQSLHIIMMIIFYQFYTKVSINWLSDFQYFLKLMLFLILITKPVNIIFKLFFSKYQVKDNIEDETITGAGATIGLLERLIMGIFLLFGQFASIGLVFTAKSIARYDKIAKNQAFAEYYLIGSLFSIICVLIIYAICLI
ncbi:DUF3307 domain-containing protein [Streptococcus mutans]|nr:DUF3307 domain-containing protein [Streptococcus mutans]MCB4998418.1 DUF3307 domain-containing protein [Streptococcus mutans]MCB5020480.1 DUF3307 domain-containing protein [Streptococcus mutans]MCB5089998.1 DUF3307 domain-containing protein [Streptococcus mutans]